MVTDVKKKVMVSGCFDLMHSGHIAFIHCAAQYGKIYVCIGSDKTVFELKKRYPVNTENERKYNISALSDVHEVCISTGSGYLDFLPELEKLKPDIFVVNEDGHSTDKQKLCAERGIQYIVLQREPHVGLPSRSTTGLRKIIEIPYRIDLAGGWLDQPFVSKHSSGAVITICIEPQLGFNERSGMATSTRKVAQELWKNTIPEPNTERSAKILFACENPPGKKEIAGSQDAIGIVYEGLNKSNYAGEYWPHSIESIHDENILSFLEDHLYLVSVGPREDKYNVLSYTHIHPAFVRALSDSAHACWNAIREMNLIEFGKEVTHSFKAQVAMFPHMVDEHINELISTYADKVKGYKISGAGGGGYLILVSSEPIENAIQIHIRRKASLS